MKVFPVFSFALTFLSLALGNPTIHHDQNYELHGTGFFDSSITIPPGFDFWIEASRLGQKIIDYANEEIALAKSKYVEVAPKIDDFTRTVSAIIQGLINQAKALEAHHIDVKEFSEAFGQEINLIFTDFKEKFGQELPENRTERYEELERAVDWTLDKGEEALIKVLLTFDVQEPKVRANLAVIKPEIKHAIVLSVVLVDRHPDLFFFMLALLIPHGLLIRTLLRLVGFGPQGPVKGSAAAWAQRYFYREAIKKDCWFAILQAAGMKYGRSVWEWIFDVFAWLITFSRRRVFSRWLQV